MAELTTSQASGSGSQTTTQSPQASAKGSGTTQSSAVQPGTSLSLLSNGSNGVSLQPKALTTVNLSATAATTQATTAAPTPVVIHHVKPVYFAAPILLLLLALFLFWFANHSVKSTTDY